METCELYCDESCTVMKNEWFKHLNQSKEVQFKEVCVQFNNTNPNENRVIHVNKYNIKLFKRESPCFIFWIMWILWSPQFQLTKQSEIECETCFLHSRNKNMYRVWDRYSSLFLLFLHEHNLISNPYLKVNTMKLHVHINIKQIGNTTTIRYQ